MHRLVDRHPNVSPEWLIAQLVLPPTFAGVSFDSYLPNPAEPSQAAALSACREFGGMAVRRRQGKKRLFGKPSVLPGAGLYLDGGFGVGKTHLLASLYFVVREDHSHPKAFATFGELTQLAGVFGFVECIDLLANDVMVSIDEVELDDPGNTVLVSRLLTELVARGVSVAATSNALPDFDALCAHLATIHPSRYLTLVEGVRAVFLTAVHPIDDQNVALRLRR